ncbi:MAG: hypothetical protein ABI654_04025 [Betaproteobacteria bacterium]
MDLKVNVLRLEGRDTKNGMRRAVRLNEEARGALENRGRFRAKHCPDSAWVFSHREGKRILNVHYGFKAAVGGIDRLRSGNAGDEKESAVAA